MTQAYLIEGGHPLKGEVACSGATKNSALKLMAASLLAAGTTTIRRVADVADIRWFADVLRHLGAELTVEGGVAEITVPQRLGVEAPYELVSRMRASTAVLAPLLVREGRAKVALPGGDFLGPRPIDLHLRGLEQMGAEIRVAHGFVEATCPGLRGAAIKLEYPSHGATESLAMAGVAAAGRTVIDNASREPEICDLASFLTSMGARISGAGTHTIEIEGVDELRPTDYEVMPDRLEAATFLMATAATGGDVVVRDMRPAHLEIVLKTLEAVGISIDVGEDRVHVRADERPNPIDISTLPYPGFPTDLQPMAMSLLTLADGTSIITENIYDARFFHVDELARMGADIRVERHYAVVRGIEELTGAHVKAADVSAGAALVIAGLAARGRTVVEDIIHIDRRYENLEGKLSGLGADIKRVEAPVPASA
ncbi:MAG: UDP-N-acetylglucosamine 1-carboxyvinyltransferase [Actinomycetota bacterium]